ncbi:MAG TPA: P-loop NTPase [Conexibacter sp.]|jgi:Mrp family chromosome partitioning ATPase/capsular polysaccharide biosynthesis protein|nr:P-loop NTPase [Conexibacter sp.]
METHTTTQPHIADYVRPLAARKWLIILAVVLATGGVYALYAHKPNVYTVDTLVFVKDPGDPVTGVSSPQSTDRNVQNEASLLYSRETADAVARRINYRGTPQELLGRVSITSKPGEDFVDVAAQGRSAQEAATIANAFARQLVTLINGSVTLRVADALKLSQSQLAQLPRGPASQAQRANLSDQINRLELAAHVPTTVARQIDTALPPAGPSAPKPLRDALFAFILSLVGAIGVAYGLERFDRRLKSPDEVEDAYGSPLLAVLPHADDPAPTQDGEPLLAADFREPFRVLRTNIDLASLDAPPRTIVVSSAMPGEGKSTVVRNLALAFRETGRRVAVVDLDLRHPALAPLFGVAGGPGMTEVLRHDAELADVMLQIGAGMPALDELVRADAVGGTARNGANGRNGHVAGAAGVGLVLSGSRPANPAAVLASERVVQVLDDLRDHHDVVLIDSAPVLAVTDTVPLLRYADAALFVGRLGVTTRDTAKRLKEFLARVPDLNVLGVVANDLSRLEAGAYGYGYGYGYGSDGEPKLRRRRWERATERPKQTA